MKSIRILAWAAVAALILAGGYIVLTAPNKLVGKRNYITSSFGGPFVMTSHKGETFTQKDLAGKPYAIFFGFTQCPEVCPTTLYEITQTITELGPDADKMNYVFVSVDPERDTQTHLETYLSNFDKRIVGLVGDAKQTATIAKAYRVYYAKQPTSDNDYTINHTATTYLMGADGKLVSTLSYQEDAKLRLKKMQQLIKR